VLGAATGVTHPQELKKHKLHKRSRLSRTENATLHWYQHYVQGTLLLFMSQNRSFLTSLCLIQRETFAQWQWSTADLVLGTCRAWAGHKSWSGTPSQWNCWEGRSGYAQASSWSQSVSRHPAAKSSGSASSWCVPLLTNSSGGCTV
jgi:hypothetical protein